MKRSLLLACALIAAPVFAETKVITTKTDTQGNLTTVTNTTDPVAITKAQILARYDLDRDGVLSPQERKMFMTDFQGYQNETWRTISAYDRDGDGMISQAEWDSIVKDANMARYKGNTWNAVLKQHDANKDGKLSEAEWNAMKNSRIEVYRTIQ